ncbi:hypothetical protein RI845_00735 [Thalassotalea nanhaiensis]|uniref:Glycoside hydrolase n=1 Tax=Thalassotalea nanhaiensis TaxID=3065648 RepID=A0ABY9TIN2_9GAMM|nr:hypothetical protein RI845_00735 [Colwelliaceae bacterium SQ345]
MNLIKSTMVIAILTSVLLSFASSAANLAGQWKGNLEIGQQSVPIIFNVTQESDKLSATMDSPLQGAKDIPVKSVEVNGNKVAFNIAVAGARYEASFEGGKLIGNWNQSGQSFPLQMEQGATAAVKKN